MNDTILSARLDALERNLKPPEEPQQWSQTFSGAHVNESIWLELGREMTIQRLGLLEPLGRIKGELKTAKSSKKLRRLWAEYGAVYEASQSIFRESREILGGLAFREKDLLDAQLCEIAEDVVLDCNRMAGTTVSLPLPGHEAVTRTLARVVRMRLPEWTIWMLPLVAHEYGRVRLDDLAGLALLAAGERERFAKGNPEWAAVLEGGGAAGDSVLETAGPMLESLVADAFAAYAMGPAYGFAAVTLALNPADTGYPSHTLRTEVILTVLERIEEDDGSRPFRAEAEDLRREWRALLSRVGRRQPALPPLVEVISEAVVREHTLRSLGYRERGSNPAGRPGTHGWRTAKDWADAWTEAIAQGRTLPVPPVERASRIHDVLNAAWLARIAVSRDPQSEPGASALAPEDAERQRVQQIETVALRLCKDVIEAHVPGDGTGVRRQPRLGDPRR